MQNEFGSNGTGQANFTVSIADSVTATTLFQNTFLHQASCSSPSSSCTDSAFSNANAPVNGTSSTTPLAGYQGMGSFGVTANQLIDIFTAFNAEVDFNGQWSGNLQVTYTFDEVVVPVPAAVWLFGSGLLGLLGMARRNTSA